MSLYGFVGKGPNPCMNERERTRIAENLLQVNVFFQTLNIQTITEEPKYKVRVRPI